MSIIKVIPAEETNTAARSTPTDLVTVAEAGDRERFAALRDEGVSIDEALLRAARDGKLKAVNALLEAGADVNMAKDGYTPLLWACERTQENIVPVLLAAGAKTEVHHPDTGYTPLIWAAHWCKSAVGEMLLAAGAKVDAEEKSGATALMHSATGYADDSAFTRLLLQHGASVEKTDKQGRGILQQIEASSRAGKAKPADIEIIRQAIAVKAEERRIAAQHATAVTRQRGLRGLKPSIRFS